MLRKIIKMRSAAITVVEFAIVMATLGASIVAIVVFRFTINTSTAASTIQKMMDKTLAFKVFASSYNCIPGDCIDAEYKVRTNFNMNGNGNGVINIYGNIIGKNEVAFVEEHLMKSKLFHKTLSSGNLDYQKIDLKTILQEGRVKSSHISIVSSGGHFYNILGGFSENNSAMPDVLNFTPVNAKVLSIIDAKADDSKADAGEIQCYAQQYTVENDVIMLPSPEMNYEKDCVLSFNMRVNSQGYTSRNEFNS